MDPTPEQVMDQALRLPRTSRAYLAERLIESLDQDQEAGLSEAWRTEIRRRCEQIDSGAVDLLPAEDVIGSLRQVLDQHRQ